MDKLVNNLLKEAVDLVAHELLLPLLATGPQESARPDQRTGPFIRHGHRALLSIETSLISP